MTKFEVWEQEPTKKTTISDVIGIIKTEEQTDSVQLKKEAQLNICERKLLDMEEDRDYYKTKSASLEEGYIKLQKENEQLKQTLEDLRTYSNDKIKEAEHINTIYKEQGFKGVIDYAKDKLQNYGVVREVEIGLWEMVTGGWSDNEFWLHCLNNPVSIFGMKHYRGYLRGGAFYYTEKPRGDVEIILKGDVE